MRWLALLAAVLAAAVLPYSRAGIGVPLVAAIVALAVALSARRSPRLLVFGGLALVLACIPAWLDAPWVVAIDLVAACLLTAAAASLTLAVVWTALRVAVVRTRTERLLLRGLVGCLCVLTLVVVASAIRRLHLYEDAFGLTRARLAAETFSLSVGALFVLVLVAGLTPAVRARFAAIAVAGGALGLLAFSLSNPDGRVAARNVERWRDTGQLDIAYVQGLSADAVPALAQLPEPLRGRVLARYRRRLAAGEPWSSANRSRRNAGAILAVETSTARGAGSAAVGFARASD